MSCNISISIKKLQKIIDEFRTEEKKKFSTSDIIRKYKSQDDKNTKEPVVESTIEQFEKVLSKKSEELSISELSKKVTIEDDKGEKISCSEWKILISFNKLQEIINVFRIEEKRKFLTSDIIRKYYDEYYKNQKNNAHFEKFLSKNSKKLGIRKVRKNVPVKKDNGKKTSCSEWEILLIKKEWPSAHLYPLNIPLPKYRYKHSTANSTDDDEDIIGRDSIMQKLLSWLKMNHGRAGTGRKHGCYLVTGSRGVGKTAFVNKVLHRYDQWLLWLYGDDCKHVDDIRINLGAERISSEGTLKTIVERLYRTTRQSWLLSIFDNNLRWSCTFFFLILLLFFTDSFYDRSSENPTVKQSPHIGSTIFAEKKGTEITQIWEILSEQTCQSLNLEFKSMWDESRCVNTRHHKREEPLLRQMWDDIPIVSGIWAELTKAREANDGGNGASGEVEGRKLWKLSRELLFPLPLVIFAFFTIWHMLIKTTRERTLPVPDRTISRKIGLFLIFSALIVALSGFERVFNDAIVRGLVLSILFVVAMTRTRKLSSKFLDVFSLQQDQMSFAKRPHELCTLFSRLREIYRESPNVLGWEEWERSVQKLLHHLYGLWALISYAILFLFCSTLSFEEVLCWVLLFIITQMAFMILSALTRRKTTHVPFYSSEVAVLVVACLFPLLLIGVLWFFSIFRLTAAIILISVLVVFKSEANGRGIFKTASTSIFKDMLSVAKLWIAMFILGNYLYAFTCFSSNSLLTVALQKGTLFCFGLCSWAEIALPMICLVLLLDYFAGNRRIEPDFQKVDYFRRQKNEDKTRHKILRNCRTRPRLMRLLKYWYYQIRYQKLVARMYKRLRFRVETEMQVRPAQWFGVFRRNMHLPYTFATLEADIIKAIEFYNDAYPYKDLLFVFDELDKISLEDEKTNKKTQAEEEDVMRSPQIKAVRSLLSDMKNILSTAEARFIFVAGTETYDNWLMDVAEKIHLVGSLFSPPIVVPTLLTDDSDALISEAHSLITVFMAKWIVDEECYNKIRHDGIKQIKRLYKDYQQTPLAYFWSYFDPSQKQYGKRANLVVQHRNVYPYLGSIAQCFSLLQDNNKENQENDINKRFWDAGLYDQLPVYLSFMTKEFIYYLTFRSVGVPKFLYLYLDKHVVEGGIKRKLQLSFDGVDRHPVQLISYFYRLFQIEVNEVVKEHGDKLVLTAFYFLGYLCRFHRSAFEWRVLESMRDVVSPYHSPQVRDVIQKLFHVFKRVCLVPIRNGVFQYRFNHYFQMEFRYASMQDVTEMPSFNFTLEQSEQVRQYYKQQAESAAKSVPECARTVPENLPLYLNVYSAFVNIGELYAQEEEYDKAIVNYKRAIQELRGLYNVGILNKRIKKAKPYCYNDTDASNIVLIIRAMLHIGLTYEKMNNYSSAYSYYAQARDFSDFLFSLFRKCELEELKFDDTILEDEDCILDKKVFPRILASPLILQPYFSIAFLLGKTNILCDGLDRITCIEDLTNKLEKFKNESEQQEDPVKETDGKNKQHKQMWRRITDSFRYHLSLCHTRDGDLYFLTGKNDMELALKKYKRALRIQFECIHVGPDDILTRWSIYQKEHLANTLSNIGDTLLVINDPRKGLNK